jgi:hypothetical protein
LAARAAVVMRIGEKIRLKRVRRFRAEGPHASFECSRPRGLRQRWILPCLRPDDRLGRI